MVSARFEGKKEFFCLFPYVVTWNSFVFFLMWLRGVLSSFYFHCMIIVFFCVSFVFKNTKNLATLQKRRVSNALLHTLRQAILNKNASWALTQRIYKVNRSVCPHPVFGIGTHWNRLKTSIYQRVIAQCLKDNITYLCFFYTALNATIFGM